MGLLGGIKNIKKMMATNLDNYEYLDRYFAKKEGHDFDTAKAKWESIKEIQTNMAKLNFRR